MHIFIIAVIWKEFGNVIVKTPCCALTIMATNCHQHGSNIAKRQIGCFIPHCLCISHRRSSKQKTYPEFPN
jgi:hypothetical protein